MTNLLKFALAGSMLALGATAANAGAIITNGNITLGVNDEGHLNVGGGTPSAGTGTLFVGLRDRNNNEATAPGCLCEGWGVADAVSGETGFANIDGSGGVFGLTLISFASTASTATSVVETPSMRITHSFGPSSVVELYRVDVSIENISTNDIGDLRYRRTMDWDIEPTAFNEYSTINSGPVGFFIGGNNNGFCSSDPLSPCNGASAPFIDLGPTDHGANFDFSFGTLAAGATRAFTIYYGAADTEAAALVAQFAEGIGLYSWGQVNFDPAGRGSPGTSTFIFGFGGVGAPPPPPVPAPATIVLFGLGLAGLGLARRRRA